jgi:mRNA interferase RelE/StbE
MKKSPAEVVWTQTAAESLRKIGSRTIQKKIADKVNDLAESGEPELLGKPLVDELQGLYRISFGRYRIVYRVLRDPQTPAKMRIILQVIFTGIRKEGDKRDIYAQIQRLLRRGNI